MRRNTSENIIEEIQPDLDFEHEPQIISPHPENNKSENIDEDDIEDGEINVSDIEDTDEMKKPEGKDISRFNEGPLENVFKYRPNYGRYYQKPCNFQEKECPRSLYVGDLSFDITHDQLADVFCKYGEIVEIDIKKLRFSDTTYAFVQFLDPISCINAHDSEQDAIIRNKTAKIGYGRVTPCDTIWCGGVEIAILTRIDESAQKMVGYKWSILNAQKQQILVKFENISNSITAHCVFKDTIITQNFLISFIDHYATRRFVGHLVEAGETVPEQILTDACGDQKFRRPKNHPESSSDEDPEKIRKRSMSSIFNRINFGEGGSSTHLLNRRKRPSPHSKTQINLKTRARSPNLSPHRPHPRSSPNPYRRQHSRSLSPPKTSSKSPSISPHSKNSRKSDPHPNDSLKSNLIWTGNLQLKRLMLPVSLTFVSGNRRVLDAALCDMTSAQEKISLLKVTERRKLDFEEREIIKKRMKSHEDTAFAILSVFPINKLNQNCFTRDFIEYFSSKRSAGVIYVHNSKQDEITHILHAIPPSSFTLRCIKGYVDDYRHLLKHDNYLLLTAMRCNKNDLS